MKKFLLGVLVGLAFAAMVLVVGALSLARFGERRPEVSDNSTLILKLKGDIPEKPEVEIPLPIIGNNPHVTVRDVWSMLRNAAADSRIKAVLLMPQGVSVGWGKLQEIHEDLLQFKKTSGKPVIAFLRGPGTREYYLATAADQIYMEPEDELNMKGMRAEAMFFKNTLDKLGAQVEVMHIGKYKDAGDMFTQTSMTPETKEVLNSMLDGLYGGLVDAVAAARKKSPDEVRALLDNGPFTSKQAQAKGLVDTLRFEDQVYGETKDRLKLAKFNRVTEHDYARISGSSLGTEGKRKIALLVGDGTILRGSSEGIGSDDGFLSEPFIKLVRKVADDKDVQGVILRVDSPGGDAVASDEILREVELLSKKKPLVISMSDVAASGGYYVSMTGDPILAYPGTITGSIGIIYGKLNLRGLYDKLGITKDILLRGQNADIDSDYHPLTDTGRAKLQETLQDFYTDFVGKAAQARKRPYEQVEPLAQGRAWLGSQAKQNGLIDGLGGLDKAIELVKQKANIRPDEKIHLVPYPAKRSIFDQILAQSSENTLETKMRQITDGVSYKLWLKGGIMRVMPYTVNIN